MFLIVMRLVGVGLGFAVLALGYVCGLRSGNVRLMWQGIVGGVMVFVQFWAAGSRLSFWILGLSIAWASGHSLLSLVQFRRTERRYRRERDERLAKFMRRRLDRSPDV